MANQIKPSNCHQKSDNYTIAHVAKGPSSDHGINVNAINLLQHYIIHMTTKCIANKQYEIISYDIEIFKLNLNYLKSTILVKYLLNILYFTL